jgi:hypothetical protein
VSVVRWCPSCRHSPAAHLGGGPMTGPTLRDTVLAYLDAHCSFRTYHVDVRDLPPPPMFSGYVDLAGTHHVLHTSGRPEVTAISLDLLAATDAALGWDGQCITMPGELRYEPVGLDTTGEYVVCRRIGP